MTTFPFVMKTFFPEVPYKAHVADRFIEFPRNGGEVWLGGLDEKERVDKILGNEYCIDPASKVLTSDLRWVRADSLAVGDEIVGFPENLDNQMKLIPSTVERTDTIQAHRLRIRTTRGDTVVSIDHKFVAYYDDRRHKNARSLSWRSAAELSVGDCIRFAAPPWEAEDTYDAGWLAGLLDGEGWVSGGSMGFAQNPGPILDRIYRLLSERGFDFRTHENSRCQNVMFSGMWSSLRAAGVLRPTRLFPKARALWENRNGFIGRGAPTSHGQGRESIKRNGAHCAEILEVEDLGVGPVIALGTSTKTLIADGFPGHNCTILLNECSQIPYGSVLVALSRLAQVVPGLKQRAFYDLNPVGVGHWSNTLFGELRDPITKKKLVDPHNYRREFINPKDNAMNLTPEFLASLEAMPERARKRFWEGVYQEEASNALFTQRKIEETRVAPKDVPQLQRIVVAVDPSGAANELETNRDDIGIAAAGLGVDGHVYVLDDATLLAGPEKWGSTAIAVYQRWKADRIVGEQNFGGAMVEYVIRSIDPSVPYSIVNASRGKVQRAEPVAALYDRRMVHHVGDFPELETELCLVAGTEVATEYGPVPIERVTVGDMVWTRRGLRKVTAARCTNPSAKVLLVKTEFGQLEGTSNHLVFSPMLGYTSLGELDTGSEVVVCLNWIKRSSSITKDSDITGTVQQGTTSHQAQGGWGSTSRFGYTNTARSVYQKVITSIIKTLITQTTSLTTLFASLLRSTVDYTENEVFLEHAKGAGSFLFPTGRGLTNFAAQCVETRQRTNATAATGRHLLVRRAATSFFGRRIARISQRLVRMCACNISDNLALPTNNGSVQRVETFSSKQPQSGLSTSTVIPVKRVAKGIQAQTVSSVETCSSLNTKTPSKLAHVRVLGVYAVKEEKPVYDLTVDDAHEFFANGFLVHNCDFTDLGYVGSRSPNRADAVIWGITELVLKDENAAGWVGYYRRIVEQAGVEVTPRHNVSNEKRRLLLGQELPPVTTKLKALPYAQFSVPNLSGVSKKFTADAEGTIEAPNDYVKALTKVGCLIIPGGSDGG
jgi:hypothetical protein